MKTKIQTTSTESKGYYREGDIGYVVKDYPTDLGYLVYVNNSEYKVVPHYSVRVISNFQYYWLKTFASISRRIK